MSWLRGFIELIGRFSVAAFFVLAAAGQICNWDNVLDYMRSHGVVEKTEIFLIAGICIEILAGLAFAFGCRPRIAAAILALFLIPTTYLFHDFWSITDTAVKEMQLANFLKNLAIFGGLLCFAAISSPAPESKPRA